MDSMRAAYRNPTATHAGQHLVTEYPLWRWCAVRVATIPLKLVYNIQPRILSYSPAHYRRPAAFLDSTFPNVLRFRPTNNNS
jgi:hypothetical protein